MENSELAIVAVVVVGVGLIGLLAYLRSVHQQVNKEPAEEIWEVKSDKQGIPEQIVVRR